MAFLKFNKAELVNLSYSLKREIILANKVGSYCNTSIVTCNTRRYHGLLAITLDRFGGDKFLMLSSLDESLLVEGKCFNLGIHCYGDIYDPRGHKYVVDFSMDPVPSITFKVGEIILRKSLILAPRKDQVLIKYELLEAPSKVELQLKPFIAFRNVNALTHKNDAANLGYEAIGNGVAFCMYKGFPSLNVQSSDKKAKWIAEPCWNEGVTYSDEYRRGFECREDLFTPGKMRMRLDSGESVIISASKNVENPSDFRRDFKGYSREMSEITSNHHQLVHSADLFITDHNDRKKINAGYSWTYTGLLRETLLTLPGITLYGLDDPEQFEEILDNLIADETERLYHRTTQVEAPLTLSGVLQAYIEYGADEKKVWEKYGKVVKGILESYLPGVRKEVSMQPNGLLWAQMDGVALSWMNAYINSRAVTERAGYQVETNAFWYNSICFALEMTEKYERDSDFINRWTGIKKLVEDNFLPVFWYEKGKYLADYVDNFGQHTEVRPNQLFAVWVKYSPLPEELSPCVIKIIDNELLTSRGIRTLSPRDPLYKGVYEGNQIERDLAYQQGSAWPFLLGPYVGACFKIKGPSFWKKAEWLTEGFYADLSKHGVGAFSELYDGDPPHEAHGLISSALSTAALLAVDYFMKKNPEGAR